MCFSVFYAKKFNVEGIPCIGAILYPYIHCQLLLGQHWVVSKMHKYYQLLRSLWLDSLLVSC
jgi:hypothetical protein